MIKLIKARPARAGFFINNHLKNNAMTYIKPTLNEIHIKAASPLALSLTGGTEPVGNPLQQVIEEDLVTFW
jgi:hypothetical protein